MSFADGTGLHCQGVVGADGLWSRTRALISDDQPICSESVAYRGTLPARQADADDELIWIGPGKHLVQYPMLQYLAQGACQAIEDAECLARHLAGQNGDFGEAFAGYQAERIGRTAQVQTVARAWGEVWHADDLIVPALRDRVFARRAADDHTDLDWLYQEGL
ncbi:hypothetical protein ACIBQ1_48695 [Nonomuraea sp. NPDC050153]|uniref:hypothetical protein n=1 Tax=Nonomuraea sp. NPDC050153 TaxID=3364359 RepID=UPI00379B630B